MPRPNRPIDEERLFARAKGKLAKLFPKRPRSASFEASRIRIIQGNVYPSYFAMPVLAVMVTLVMLTWHPPEDVAIWAVCFAAVSVFSIYRFRSIETSGSGVSAEMLSRRLLVGTLWLTTSSALWAFAAFYFWVPGETLNHMMLQTMMAGALPMIVALTGSSLRAVSIHAAPVVVAIIVPGLLEGGAQYYAIAAMAVLYCALNFGTAIQMSSSVHSMLIVKEHNTDLLIQVASAKAESDAARYRAERANKAKSTFLASMSHELRTPLNAILGFSEVIKNEMLGPVGQNAYQEYAGDIHSSGQHLLRLINDILDLSRIEAGKLDLSPVELDVSDAVEDAVRFVEQRAVQNGLSLVRRIAPDLPFLLADERALRQILLNLLSNAVKFTKPGGTVTISAETGREGGLTITVSDTGVGIEAEDIPLVLESFGQVRIVDLALTSNPEQGTGLGLPIVRGLTEAHGGQFELKSVPGQGTDAIVRFPRSAVAERWPDPLRTARAR